MVEARHARPWPVPDWKRERHEPSGAVALLKIDGRVEVVQSDEDPGDMGEPRIVHDGDADLTVVVVPSFGYWALDSLTDRVPREIRERDLVAALCSTCGRPAGGAHDSTVEECNAAFAPGRVCDHPGEHHPYSPGTEFQSEADGDRRLLLEMIDAAGLK